jgi:LSD1 subclass zinc finger protein
MRRRRSPRRSNRGRQERGRHATEIDELEESIERFRIQLNTTKHQKEYDAIQHAILSHRADIERLEDRELLDLQTVDVKAAEEERYREETQQAEEELARVRASVETAARDYRQRIDQLADERERLRGEIEPGVLAAYERLINSGKRSNALVTVRNRVCQGCFTQITKQTENLLMHDQELVHCHSCGRLLMLPEDHLAPGAR